MKKSLFFKPIFFIILSVQLFTLQLMSAPVDSVTARRAATNFYNWKTGKSVDVSHAQLAYIQRSNSQDMGTQTIPIDVFYVFNFGNNFVILSADTRVTPLLAYSTESGFNIDNIPEALNYHLNEYVREIEIIVRDLTDAESETTINEWNRLLSGNVPIRATTTNVGPLVQTTWNQSTPYNSMCPADANGSGGHAYAGCVACAMAQIIRYWQYPSSGIGTYSYTANNSSSGYGDYGTQYVNFSSAYYDYSLMPLSLNSNSSQAQINEVAKLMYHCGVSVDMKYGPNGSAASVARVPYALQTYFGFGDSSSIKYRFYYTNNDWISLIKNELNNLRPVCYAGGDHCFVCDGYDNLDLFHFNWGWSGVDDGFYTISNLNPLNANYNSLNAAIIGIDVSQPAIHLSDKSLSFITEMATTSESKAVSVLTAHLNTPITVTVTGNFEISTNNSDFSTTCSFSSSGGTLYIRYYPTINNGIEHGYVIATSGTITDTIFLTGAIYNNTPFCLPPENLIISSQDMHNTLIQWETPVIDSDPHTLTWSSSVKTYLGYSQVYQTYQRSILQRYCDTDLLAYHNQALTSISFFAKSSATVFKAVVYKGGYYNGNYNPGTLVLSQDIDINSLNLDAWNTVTLDTPIVVDATQELWFGIYLEAPGGTHSIPISTHSVPTKGCILGTHSSSSVSWDEYDSDFSFCISGTTENIQMVTNYQVSREDTIIGNTTGNSFQDYISNTNTYTYTVTANWNNGCSASVQRSYTNLPQIATFPEVLTFFTNYGHNNLIKKINVSGNGLATTITAIASGNFLISTDSVNFSLLVTLPTEGGVLFVKYIPSSSNTEYETGLITLTSGNLNSTVSLNGQCFAECNPPQDLVISNIGNNTINLSWETPAAIHQEELTWYISDAYMDYESNYSINQYLVHRFDTGDLSPYHGKRLTAISFVPSSSATTYKLVVYQGGSMINTSYNNFDLFNSGIQLVEQNVNINSLNMDIWNTIPLDEPITIDANQELWYGIYLEAPPAESCPIKMGYPYVANKGLITKNASGNYWYEYFHTTNCFSLKATIEDSPISLTHYQVDRNNNTLGETENTFYNDYIMFNEKYDYDVWAVWDNGCRAPIRGSIEVGLCDSQGSSYTVEQCESYEWHEINHTESGIFYYSYTDANGCPIIDTLFLTINHGTHNVETETACESFTWHGQTYTASGIYTYDYDNAEGCSSVDTLYLTINHGTHNVETETACESFTWHGTTYTTSGTYEYEYTNASNCPSVDTLKLTVNPTYNTPVTVEICEGSSYDFFGQTLTTAGTYTHTLQSVAGCDSVITLTLTVNPTDFVDFAETVCEEYVWNSETFAVSGDYTRTFTNAAGCDSIVTLHLTINPAYNITIHDTAIREHEYVLGDFSITPAEAGIYMYDFQYSTENGCDSIIHLVLHVANNDGIAPYDFANVEVFPNPTNKVLNINGKNMRQIMIYNADGQVVYTSDELDTDLKTLDVSHYAAGQYLVKIIFDNKQSVTKKVIVNR